MIPAEVVRIKPVSRWARNKVHEHGEVFFVRRRRPGGVMVESLERTSRGTTWLGWFDVVDADEQVITNYVQCPRCKEDVDVRELAAHLETCKPRSAP